MQVLAFCEAPYTPQFARRMVALTARCGLTKLREGGRQGELRTRLLQEFVQAVRGMHFDVPLTAAQQTYLSSLAADCYY